MTKQLLNIMIFILCVCILTGCNHISDANTDIDGTTDNNVNDISINDETNDMSINDETMANSAIGGGDAICPVHNTSYHAYPDALISYIGEERFMEWANTVSLVRNSEGCYPDGNILICIEHFNVPNDVILEIYKNDYVNSDWDIKALLDHDATALDEDARTKASSEEYKIYSEKMRNEISMKYELFNIMKSKTDIKTVDFFNETTENGTSYPVYEVTIADMVTNTSLTIDDLNNALDRVTKNNTEPYEFQHFEYDFDLLFDTGVSTMSTNIDAITMDPYDSEIKLTDALLHVTGDSEIK